MSISPRFFRWGMPVAAVLCLAAGPAGQGSAVSPNAEVAGLKARFIDVDGVRTRYYDYGQGEPMVLVHGGGRGTTSSANNWSPVIPLLAKRFHVIAVDKSAAGMTGNPKDDNDLSPAGEVKHMYRFIQTMKLGPVHLVGHSSGGALAFYLATEHPDVIKTLTIVAHGPAMPPAGDGPTRHDVLQTEKCKAPQTTYEGRKCRLELFKHKAYTFDDEFLKADAWMADQPKSREAREKYARRAAAAPAAPETNPYRERAWEKARSGALQMPILIYAAKQDTLSWDNDDAHAMMRGELGFFDILGAKNPRVTLTIANDGGHFMYRDHPERFVSDLSGFIAFSAASGATRSTAAAGPDDAALGAALARGDRNAAAALMDDQFRRVERNGLVRMRAEVLDRLTPETGAAAVTDVQTHNYGTVAMFSGTRRIAAENASVRFLHIWVKRPSGWRAFIYHENTIFPPAPSSATAAPAAAPPAGAECDNPCKFIPYETRSADEAAILDSWKQLETAVAGHDPAEWARHAADEFVVIRQRYTGSPTTKADRMAQIEEAKKSGAVSLPGKVVWLQMWVFGDAAVQLTRHVPAVGNPAPYRVSRVWVKRDGRWQMAVSQQTSIEERITTDTAPGSYDGSIGGLKAKFIDVNGIRARYYEAGQGEPMVLLHGGFVGGSSTANVWSRNIAGLAKRFHVFAVDRIGSGLTGNTPDDDYGNAAQVTFIHNFIRALKLDAVHLVGHSAGGAVAFYTAIEHPEVAKTLTIVGVGPASPRGGEGASRLEPELKKCPDQEQYAGLKCRVEKLGWLPDTFDDEYWAADVYMAAQPNTTRARAAATAAGRDTRRVQENTAYRERAWEKARSGALTMPIMIYAGKQDVLDWSLNEPTAMLRGELNMFDMVGAKNERVKMIVVNEGGHFMYREHPEQFNADLFNFIDSWNARSATKPTASSTPAR